MKLKTLSFIILAGLPVTTSLYAQTEGSPIITSFTPISGPIGASVIITGTGFDATPSSNTVFFGAVQAAVSDATTTKLTATVPAGATHMPITVLVNGLLAFSPTPFAVTFDGIGISSSSFDTKVDYATGASPEAAVLVDLDGDNKTDMVVVNENANSISILRNNSTSPGSIIYAPKIDYLTGDSPYAISTGDLDGDGKPDLAVGVLSSLTISVFRNTSSVEGGISFAPSVNFYLGSWNQPYSISIGDLDNDGRADIAAAMYFNNKVLILRNTSNSSGVIEFASKVEFTTAESPVSVSMGDFDNDNKLDLVVANANANSISILRNTNANAGTISFATKVDYTTGPTSYPRSVSTGDLNGDNKIDITIACQSGKKISVFRNTSSDEGDISFQKMDFATEASPISVSIGNLDGDGKAELVVTNGNNTVSAFRNTATSAIISFAVKVNYTTGSNPRSVSIGDLDGDGKPELAIVEKGNNTISILRNTISPGPATNTNIIAFAFSDQTGIANIDTINYTVDVEVASSDLSALIASFTLSAGATAKVNSTDQSSGITANDFTNSVTYTILAADLITSQDWIVTVAPKSLVLPAITSFTPASGPIGTSVTISGNGFNVTPANNIVYFGATKTTVLAATATELTVSVPAGASYMPVSVLANKLTAFSSAPFVVTFEGKGIDSSSFATKVDYAVGGGRKTSVTIGDLDRDGNPDLISGVDGGKQAYGSVSRNITTNMGTTNFAASINFLLGSMGLASGSVGQVQVLTGDFDNDGKLDFTAIPVYFDFLYIFRNTSSASGTISVGEKVVFPARSCNVWVSTADFDHDGKIDLAVASPCNNTISFFRNTSLEPGTIYFADKIDYPMGAEPCAISTGDFDDDGKIDLAVANYGSNTISLLKNTSTIGVLSFDSKVDFPTGIRPISVSSGDLDRDGKADLIVTNNGGNTISVLRNKSSMGTLSFNTKEDYPAGTNPYAVSMGDLNGDGKVDLAVVNAGSNTVSVFRNTSASPGIISLASKVDFATGSGPMSVSIGDLDGDGKADLAVANNSGASISILRNRIMPPSSDTDITSFNFSEQTKPAIIDLANHTIDIEVAKDIDVAALVATFTLSAGATAKVNSVDQLSGSTANDFTTPVSYTVIAEDEITTQTWTVTVTIKPNEMPVIYNANFIIEENSALGTLVGKITASDPDDDDLAFSIISGNESGAFQIDSFNGDLFVADSIPLDFETIPTINLKIQVTDGDLANWASIVVNLIDVDDTPVVGIRDESVSLNIYPNPISNRLTIQWDEFELCIIHDLTGRQVLISPHKELHLSELPKGLYTLTLIGKTKRQIQARIVKD